MIVGYTKRSGAGADRHISPQDAGTLYGLFRERLRRTPDKAAYRAYDFAAQRWEDWTWHYMGRQVARWQAAFSAEGLQPGDRVALMLRNCPQWVMLDQAALGLGLVVVPLYTQDRADNVAYVLNDSGAKLLLIEGSEQWELLYGVRDRLQGLQCIVSLQDTAGQAQDARLRRAADWLPNGDAELAEPRGQAGDLATIVYTSGTTGPPKGVMLSHANILHNAWGGLQSIDVDPQDLFLSFLPLSHALERTVGYYIPVMAGSTVAYARSIPDLAEDLATIRPTVLVSVPRIFERVYDKIQAQLENKPPAARTLFHGAVDVGWRGFLWRQGRAPWGPALLNRPLLHALVARKVHARLGGRLRLAISGGAPLSPAVARMFIGLGVTIAQGYGLTENSPVISVNRLDDNDPESVGAPLPGLEVRLGDNDELLVRGPCVMQGYWNNEAATAEVIDAEGWLHTGDKVRIEDGRIYITGRIKDIIVLSNGEKVSPAEMEMAITTDPLFEQALVVGEGRPVLVALVVLDQDVWKEWAGHDPDGDPEERLLARIGGTLRSFPGYARIRRVAVCDEPWAIENGLLTPTLKPKRGRILERYAGVVEALYQRR